MKKMFLQWFKIPVSSILTDVSPNKSLDFLKPHKEKAVASFVNLYNNRCCTTQKPNTRKPFA